MPPCSWQGDTRAGDMALPALTLLSQPQEIHPPSSPHHSQGQWFPPQLREHSQSYCRPCNHKSEDWPREPGLPLKDHRNIFRDCPTKIRLKVMVLPWFPRIFLSKREVVPSYKSHLPFSFLEAPCGCTKRGSSGLHQAE